MQQNDLIGVAKLVNACLQKMDPSVERISNQSDVAGTDVKWF